MAGNVRNDEMREPAECRAEVTRACSRQPVAFPAVPGGMRVTASCPTEGWCCLAENRLHTVNKPTELS